MKTNRQYLRWGLAVLAAALLIYYCKNCVGHAGQPVSYVGDKNGNTLNIRIEAAANDMNPYLSTGAYSRSVAAQIFQSLGIVDPESLELVPLIVKAIPKSRIVTEGPYKGSLAYDFEIIPEAVWDNGTPVTGNDLIFTYKVQLNPHLGLNNFAGYIGDLKNIEVDPANPKKFTAYFGKYYILAVETLCQTNILPAYHYDPENLLGGIPLPDLLDAKKAEALSKENENLKKFAADFRQPKYSTDPASISGSGPYQPESIGELQTVLVKKQNWWGDKLRGSIPLLGAYPDRLVYKFQRDEGVIENLLRTGDLDVALTISPAKYFEMKKDSLLAANYDFQTRPAQQYNRWLFNLRNPKLSDKLVRQALSHLVDYDYLLNTVQHGLAQRIVGPINPSKPYYAKNITPYDFNVQKAKDLLTQAGWTDTDSDGIVDKNMDGQRTPLSIDVIATTTSPVTEQIATSIEKTCRLAGVKINIIPIDLQKLSEETKAGRFEAALFGLNQYPGQYDFYQNYHSASLFPAGDNRGALVSPEFDQLIEAIRGTEDVAKRNELYIQAQQFLYDQAPEVFLYSPQQRYIGTKRYNCIFTVNRPGYYEQLFQLKKPAGAAN